MCGPGTGPGEDAFGLGHDGLSQITGHVPAAGPETVQGSSAMQPGSPGPRRPLPNGRQRAPHPLQVVRTLAVAPAQKYSAGLLEKRSRKPVKTVPTPSEFLRLAIYRGGLDQPAALPTGLLGATVESAQKEHVTDRTKSLFGARAPEPRAKAAYASRVSGFICRWPAIFKGTEHVCVSPALLDKGRSRARPQTSRKAGIAQAGDQVRHISKQRV